MRQIGTHLCIHCDGSVRHQPDAALLQKGGVWTDAQRQDDHIRLQLFSCHLYTLRLCGTGHCLQTGVQADLDALLFHVIFGKLCHLRVEAGHNLLCHVDDGDRQTLFHQVFCHLQSDETASCDYGTLCIVLLQILPQVDGILWGADGEDTRQGYSR